MIVASLQPDVDKVVAWSGKARLTLNTSKCETAFFSLDCAEAAWQPNIINPFIRNPFPFFFVSDKTGRLTIAEHVRELCQWMSGRLKHLSSSSGGTTWGWHTTDCRQVYIAIVRSMLECAARAPWPSATSTSTLDNVQFRRFWRNNAIAIRWTNSSAFHVQL